MNLTTHTRFAHIGRPSTEGRMIAVYKREAKRTAKVATRALFRKELPVELSLTPAEVDEATRVQRELELAEEYRYAELQEQAQAANQRWMRRLGEGTQVWEQVSAHAWKLSKVLYDDDYGEYWTSTLAWVRLNHTHQVWEVDAARDLMGQPCVFPLASHNFEEMQAVAHVLLALNC